MNERADRTRCTYDKVAVRFLENTRDRSVVSQWLRRFAAFLGRGATVLLMIPLVYVATYLPFLAWQRYKTPALPFFIALACVVLVEIAARRAEEGGAGAA